jgi:hypothetical protein
MLRKPAKASRGRLSRAIATEQNKKKASLSWAAKIVKAASAKKKLHETLKKLTDFRIRQRIAALESKSGNSNSRSRVFYQTTAVVSRRTGQLFTRIEAFRALAMRSLHSSK